MHAFVWACVIYLGLSAILNFIMFGIKIEMVYLIGGIVQSGLVVWGLTFLI